MAAVSLKNVMKIYPHSNDAKPKKAKKAKNGEAPEEKKVNLQVTEKGVVAVQQFDLDIADQEFIVLVGPSGCGKSTTLRMIAGLEDISEGELIIDGKLVNDVAPKDRDIAMVFQSYALYPHMTVRENMEFPLKLKKKPGGKDANGNDVKPSKMSREEIDHRVEEAAEILGITQYLDRKPKALSGGQRQRVAIGRAIVREPKVLLMDEPLSNLDAKLRNQMRAEIIKLRQKINSTFIYVTHDQVEAMTLGDRIVIMRDGFIQQIGTPQQVFDHPANLFVAGFIGTPQMNFFDGELLLENGQYIASVCGTRIALPEDKQAALKAANTAPQAVTLGIRPDHIVLCQENDPQAITATVDVTELMGATIHMHISIQGKDAIVILPTIDLSSEQKNGFRYGSQVNVAFRGNVVHLFSKETEISLL